MSSEENSRETFSAWSIRLPCKSTVGGRNNMLAPFQIAKTRRRHGAAHQGAPNHYQVKLSPPNGLIGLLSMLREL